MYDHACEADGEAGECCTCELRWGSVTPPVAEKGNSRQELTCLSNPAGVTMTGLRTWALGCSGEKSTVGSALEPEKQLTNPTQLCCFLVWAT